jgi:protein-tyrosine phosphatase
MNALVVVLFACRPASAQLALDLPLEPLPTLQVPAAAPSLASMELPPAPAAPLALESLSALPVESLSAAAPRPDPEEPLAGFRNVAPNLYRSAQPTRKGVKLAFRAGIRRILDLREVVDADEFERARKLGIQIIHVPMLGSALPTFEELDAALSVLEDLTLPTLVHCRHGQDRTGVVIAAWRVVHQNIVPSVAAMEARDMGYQYPDNLEAYLLAYLKHRQGR